MNLNKKKELAKRTFGVGEKRIVFIESRLEDIKEAITKQDMRDLREDGAILVTNVAGRRRKITKRSRSPGNIRKKVNKRKKEYVTITRKLRKHLRGEKEQGNLSKEESDDLRKKVRNRIFKSKAQLKEHLRGIKK